MRDYLVIAILLAPVCVNSMPEAPVNSRDENVVVVYHRQQPVHRTCVRAAGSLRSCMGIESLSGGYLLEAAYVSFDGHATASRLHLIGTVPKCTLQSQFVRLQV